MALQAYPPAQLTVAENEEGRFSRGGMPASCGSPDDRGRKHLYCGTQCEPARPRVGRLPYVLAQRPQHQKLQRPGVSSGVAIVS